MIRVFIILYLDLSAPKDLAFGIQMRIFTHQKSRLKSKRSLY